MGRSVIALVVVAAALAAPSSLAQVVLAQSVFRAASLPANTNRAFTVRCPAGYVAVSAGVSSPAPGATLLGIRPSGLAAYTFRFGHPVTNSGQQVKVVVACRRFSSKLSTRLKVTPLHWRVKVPAGKLAVTGVVCPPSTGPAGWGFDVPEAAGRVSVRKASMDLRGFSFSLRNSGPRTRSVTLYATCLTAFRPAGTSREQLHVSIRTFRVPLQAGSQRVVRNCPAGWVSLAGGYALRSPLTTIDGVAAIGQRGRWWIGSNSKGRPTADLQLVCGR
jgi:hypothetical protein